MNKEMRYQIQSKETVDIQWEFPSLAHRLYSGATWCQKHAWRKLCFKKKGEEKRKHENKLWKSCPPPSAVSSRKLNSQRNESMTTVWKYDNMFHLPKRASLADGAMILQQYKKLRRIESKKDLLRGGSTALSFQESCCIYVLVISNRTNKKCWSLANSCATTNHKSL